MESKWRFLICFCLVCNQRYDLNHFSKWPELLSTFISQRYMLKNGLALYFLFLQRNCRRRWSWVSFRSSVGTHPCNVRLKWSHECRGLTCLLVIDWRRKYSCIVPKSSISSSRLSWKCCNLINRAIAKPLSWFLPLSNAHLHVLGDPISWLWQNIKGIFVNSNI